MEDDFVELSGVKVHKSQKYQFKNSKNKLVVICGISGSGKSSLAFDTIFQEGQRRYLESLSSYARQFLGGFKKPDVEKISGLSPTIAVNQKQFLPIRAQQWAPLPKYTTIYDCFLLISAIHIVPNAVNQLPPKRPII